MSILFLIPLIIHSTFSKSCFPLRGQPKGQKRKKRTFSIFIQQIFERPVIKFIPFPHRGAIKMEKLQTSELQRLL